MSVAKRNSPPVCQNARQPLETVVLDEAPLPVPPLRPWIGIEQIDARERSRGQPVEQLAGVAEMQSDIAERIVLDGRQRLADGIDETVAADEAAARVGLRLRDQMLGAAEADFEPYLVRLMVEKRAQIGGRGLAEIERELGQQRRRTALPAAPATGDPCGGRRRRAPDILRYRWSCSSPCAGLARA